MTKVHGNINSSIAIHNAQALDTMMKQLAQIVVDPNIQAAVLEAANIPFPEAEAAPAPAVADDVDTITVEVAKKHLAELQDKARQAYNEYWAHQQALIRAAEQEAGKHPSYALNEKLNKEIMEYKRKVFEHLMPLGSVWESWRMRDPNDGTESIKEVHYFIVTKLTPANGMVTLVRISARGARLTMREISYDPLNSGRGWYGRGIAAECARNGFTRLPETHKLYAKARAKYIAKELQKDGNDQE